MSLGERLDTPGFRTRAAVDEHDVGRATVLRERVDRLGKARKQSADHLGALVDGRHDRDRGRPFGSIRVLTDHGLDDPRTRVGRGVQRVRSRMQTVLVSR